MYCHALLPAGPWQNWTNPLPILPAAPKIVSLQPRAIFCLAGFLIAMASYQAINMKIHFSAIERLRFQRPNGRGLSASQAIHWVENLDRPGPEPSIPVQMHALQPHGTPAGCFLYKNVLYNFTNKGQPHLKAYTALLRLRDRLEDRLEIGEIVRRFPEIRRLLPNLREALHTVRQAQQVIKQFETQAVAMYYRQPQHQRVVRTIIVQRDGRLTEPS